MKNFPLDNQMTAWFRDKTLQSKIALFSDIRFLVIDRPTLTSWSGSRRIRRA